MVGSFANSRAPSRKLYLFTSGLALLTLPRHNRLQHRRIPGGGPEEAGSFYGAIPQASHVLLSGVRGGAVSVPKMDSPIGGTES